MAELHSELRNVGDVVCVFVCSCRDTAGQERFRTITTAYYRGAMVRQAATSRPHDIQLHCGKQACCFCLFTAVVMMPSVGPYVNVMLEHLC